MAAFPLQAQTAPGAGVPHTPAPDAFGKLVGTARLTVFGFDVYTARLWSAPGLRRANWDEHAFALELAYLRDFEGASIAQRSLKEMQRVGDFTEGQGRQWLARMTALFPDVRKGDRITGIHQPGAGVSFLLNDRPLGEIRDAQFARAFMGIWLSPKTSEPAMRDKLLAEVAP